MSKPILFTITNAGKAALASGVTLSKVAVGSGSRTITGGETSLKSEILRSQVISGGVEGQSNVLRFSTAINVDSEVAISEIGLLTSTGILFAVADGAGTPFFTISDTETFAGSFGFAFGDLDSSGITIDTAANNNIALSIMEGHLAADDPHTQYLPLSHANNTSTPHEQYLNKDRFNLLLDTVFHVGCFYFTHSDDNPKPLFDALLGVETAWRRVTGKIIVGADPDDQFVEIAQFNLGQQGMTSQAVSQRPNAYPLHTTHLWERYEPNTETVLYDGKHKYDGKNQYQ